MRSGETAPPPVTTSNSSKKIGPAPGLNSQDQPGPAVGPIGKRDWKNSEIPWAPLPKLWSRRGNGVNTAAVRGAASKRNHLDPIGRSKLISELLYQKLGVGWIADQGKRG